MRRVLFIALAVCLPLAAQKPAPNPDEPYPPKPGQVFAKDGSGVFGYRNTDIQPWSGYHIHDPDRPAPPRVTPGEQPGQPPSDAVILFDGTDLAKWNDPGWRVADGYVEAATGHLVTKDEFGDIQLHIEWRVPDPPQGETMNRGNSGVNLMGVFEIQIHDTFSVPLAADSRAGAIYAQTPPMVTAVRKPGEWQTYDIVFLAPRFQDGELSAPPRLTVFHNGVLIHHNQEIYGRTVHRHLAKPFEPGRTEGPILLGAHRNPVRFRNIWLRKLGD